MPQGPPDHPRPPGQPGPGDVLVARYELQEVLRVGPLGTRWLARDLQLDRQVTVKLVFTHAVDDPVAREWFRRESLATARVRHPNVVDLYDAHATDEHVFLVLEYVNGRGLEELDGVALDPPVVAALGCQVADGLAAAHAAGVVHRDIRPANLLVAASGHVKITNFTLSTLRDQVMASNVTIEPTLREMFGHVAPEQLAGDEPGPAADVYSLGLTLWEALRGLRPFADDPLPTAALRRQHEALPPALTAEDGPTQALVRAIDRATQPLPEHRHGSAKELADELRDICGPRPHEITRGLLDTLPIPVTTD